jgi:ribosomal protein S19
MSYEVCRWWFIIPTQNRIRFLVTVMLKSYTIRRKQPIFYKNLRDNEIIPNHVSYTLKVYEGQTLI